MTTNTPSFPTIHFPADPAADAVDLTAQALIVRPIVFTPDPQGWRNLLSVMGAEALTSHPEWSVHSLPGGGRLAIHATDGPAHCELGFAVPGRATLLATVAPAVQEAGGRLHEVIGGQGATLRLVLPGGAALWIDDAVRDPEPDADPDTPGPPATAKDARRAVANTGVSVAPLVMTTMPAEDAACLEALGLRPGLSAESGGWHDLRGEGAVGVHRADATAGPSVEAGFWAEDIEALAVLLKDAGVRCEVVDEAFGRTLLVEHPDHPESGDIEPDLPGRRLWITEVQRDTYGYVDRREAAH